MRSKTDSPPLVMYWSRMAEIRATVFPDFEGPRKMPVHGTRGTIGSRGCFEVYSAVGKSFTFPISIPGSPRSPGTAGAAGSTTGFGSGRASAGCLASERFRGAGRPGKLRSGRAWSRPVGWESKAGCSIFGWSSGSESRTCSRTHRCKAAPACRADSSAARFADSRRPTIEAGGAR